MGLPLSLCLGIKPSGGRRLGALQMIEPSASWDGTAASGFTSAPTDPTRTTAKPAMRLLVPPRQWFTDTLLVGVLAMASNEGSMLDNLGLDKVRVYFESDTPTDILAPSFQTFEDVNGNPVTYYGWWARIKKPAGTAGVANVYFEAVPSDATMQNRVIGPFVFCPEDTQYDGSLTVGTNETEVAGTTYTNLDDATNYAKSQGWQNPLITIVEAGLYGMEADAGAAYADQTGYFNIEASVPGVSIGSTDPATIHRIQNNKGRLHFKGENLTIDMQGIIEIAGSTGPDSHGMHWLDGVTITTTHPDEEFELLYGEKIDQFGWRVERLAWFTECTISKLAGSTGDASLVRGCTWDQITYDICANIRCIIDNEVTSHSDTFWGENHAVFTATYTGSEATATLERTGGAAGNDIYWYARWGANEEIFHTGDFDYWNGGGGDGYSVQHVVDWLNTLPGWTAAANNATVAGYIAGRVSAVEGGASGGFTQVSVKGTVHQFYIQWARHSDFYQIAAAPTENVIVSGNKVDQAKVQSLLLGPAGGGVMNDVAIFNNIFHMSDDEQGSYSQIGKANCNFSHLIVAHNSWVNQQLSYRFDSGSMAVDSYSLLANNTMTGLGYSGGDAQAVNNHLHDGATAPTNGTGTTIGGTKATLYADPNGGNFSPAGELLTNQKPPVLRYDRAKVARGATAPVGALGE